MATPAVSSRLADSAVLARIGAEVFEERSREVLEDDALEEERSEETEVALDEIIRQQFEPTPSEPDFGEAPFVAEPEEVEALPWPELNGAALPVQPDEFVCCRCFLIKRRVQLGDPVRRLCHDCTIA